MNRIPCPECGAGIKSSAGFTLGETVCCPKCETYFEVDEPEEGAEEPAKKGKPAAKTAAKGADDDAPKGKKKKSKKSGDDEDDEEWSYKNSWIRYAVLGVLIVVMSVLAYMLWKKKQDEANSAAPAPTAVERGHTALMRAWRLAGVSPLLV